MIVDRFIKIDFIEFNLLDRFIKIDFTEENLLDRFIKIVDRLKIDLLRLISTSLIY